jgi:hypothetical protein
MDKGKEVIGGDVPAIANATQKLPTIRRPLICNHYGLSAHFSKLRDRRSRRSCQDKLHSALDFWLGIRLHGIKPLGIRLLNISCNSSDLFLPIRMANPR